jgi:L-lactate dehydrogenase
MQCKSPCRPSTKVAIIGAGFVGSTTAYALMLDGVASEIALIDINKNKVEGEVLDLAHCMQFTQQTTITASDSFELVKDAAVIVISAGMAQAPHQTRTDLLEANTKLFKKIIPEIVRYNDQAILLVVTNPLDVLTYVTWKLSGLSPCQVFGTGTVLDTARLRYLMGQYFSISPKDITASILGEHGDSEFVWWSRAQIAGVQLDQLPGYSLESLTNLYEKTKSAAYEIISKKGSTSYAIALVVCKIVKAILRDQSRAFTVSTYLDHYAGVQDVFLSVPTIVRRGGICQRLEIDLDEQEQKFFKASAYKVKSEIDAAMALIQ